MSAPEYLYPYLTFDLATRTGWACQTIRGGPVEFGHIVMPKTGADIGRFLYAFEQFAVPLLAEKQPGAVAFEAPLFKGGGKSNLTTARKLIGLANHLEYLCFRGGTPCFQGHVQEVKRHYTGNGRADPVQDVAFVCCRRGIDVGNDGDAAMAVALLSWTVARLDPEMAGRDLFNIAGTGGADG